MTQRSNPNLQPWYLWAYTESDESFCYVVTKAEVAGLPEALPSQEASKTKVLEALKARPPREVRTAFRRKEGAPFEVGAHVRRVKGKGGTYYLRTDADHLMPNNLGEVEDVRCTEDLVENVGPYPYDWNTPNPEGGDED